MERVLILYPQMGSGTKRVLLVDAVNWSDAYSSQDPLRNVDKWFRRHFTNGTFFSSTSAETFIQNFENEQWDGLIISGSPRDAYIDDDFTRGLLRRLEKVTIPMLGVCYGHQILARALGGRVGKNPQGLELGNSTVQLTEAGSKSPIFNSFPHEFDVLQSHGDVVLNLPATALLLATNPHSPIQAFQSGESIYGVQFHPETDPEILKYLWKPRIGKWKGHADFKLEDRLKQMEPAPASHRVLHNFVNNL